MEDHTNYFSSIQKLRIDKTSSLVEHFRRTSQLSQLLIQSLTFTILLLALVAILNNQLTTDSLAIGNLIVFLCILIQAFLVLFLVHWKWNRLDLSVDAVIKFFASGFLLTTGLAMFFEMLTSTAFQIIFEILAALWNSVDNHTLNEEDTTTKTTTYPILTLLYLILNAYAVAALIEELCKYFGFWMVDHPDLAIPVTAMSTIHPLNGEPVTNVLTTEEAPLPTESSLTDTTTITTILSEQRERRSYVSLGSAITISMIAVSLGFACCENLIYVFIYARGNVNVEMTVLLMRSLFPIHPLAAAIQSIGVVKRDIEGIRQFSIGRIIFPAVILHGTFDFLLMLMAFIGGQYSSKDDNKEDETISSTMVIISLICFVTSILVVLIGFCFYFKEARAQRARLAILDNHEILASAYISLV